MFDVNEFQQRKTVLMQHMGEGIAVIPTAREAVRNRDSHYPYRFDSYFYYLTGFKEPEAVVVLIAGKENKSVLFCREKHEEREIWDGFRYGPDAAKTEFGFDETYSYEQLDEKLPELMANQPKLFYSLGSDCHWDSKMTGFLNQLREQARKGVHAPESVLDIRTLIDEMRLIKSAYELKLMQTSADIAASAHIRAMQTAQVGQMEYEIEAEFLHEFARQGAQAPAYTSIVAGGAHACTLHYIANNARLNDGDLLLIDAGCELEGYASDITRTFPVNGQFSAPQKDLYELVLAAQTAAIAQVNTNNHWNAPHEAALNVLVDGFIHYGLCKGTRDAVIESGAYQQFYMHRTGHWLGLDVHDAGSYKSKASDWRMLEAGHVLTVEPGCYVRPADNVPEHFWNIGIRIEDDVVVTKDGCKVMTDAVPKSVGKIEQLMRGE